MPGSEGGGSFSLPHNLLYIFRFFEHDGKTAQRFFLLALARGNNDAI